MGSRQLKFGGGFEVDGLDQQRLGDGGFTGLQRECAQRVQRIGVPRRGCDHLAVNLFCLRQPPRPVELLALAEEGVDLLRSFAHAPGSSAGGRKRAMMEPQREVDA
jgi:hypothetical protein